MLVLRGAVFENEDESESKDITEVSIFLESFKV